MEHLSVLLILCIVVAAGSTPLTADFGKLHFGIDVAMGDDYLAVTMLKPLNAPETFRQTTNLHIFSRGMVAMRNCRDGECYVRPFVESEEMLKEKVKQANNNMIMGNITLERLTLRSTPLRPQAVYESFGRRIADFCIGFNVFVINKEDAAELDPEAHFEQRDPNSHNAENQRFTDRAAFHAWKGLESKVLSKLSILGSWTFPNFPCMESTLLSKDKSNMERSGKFWKGFESYGKFINVRILRQVEWPRQLMLRELAVAVAIVANIPEMRMQLEDKPPEEHQLKEEFPRARFLQTSYLFDVHRVDFYQNLTQFVEQRTPWKRVRVDPFPKGSLHNDRR